MKLRPLILPFAFMGCVAPPPPPIELPIEPPAEPPIPVQCEAGEFRGDGIGTDEKEALKEAKADLAKQIHSSVRVSETYRQSQNVQNGMETLGSDFVSETLVEANLLNAQDARIAHKSGMGDKINIAVCMSRENAAKGFAERLRPVADSLEFSANAVVEAKHPRSRGEAWQKTQPLQKEFARLYSIIEGLSKEKAASFESVAALYAKARDEYLSYCQSAKLHWKPEKESEHSSMAFSILSRNLKMEKSACQGGGILLAYRHAEPGCSRKFGVHNCFYKPSLSIFSCDGTEYSALESIIESSHQKQELALEKIEDAFKAADFWGEWEREIREWSPKCE